MGMLQHLPFPNTYCWVMGEPKDENFMKPTKLKFHRLIFEINMPEIKGWGSYQETMDLENGVKIPVYDSGMKSGHRMLLNYYVTHTSRELFEILGRMISLDKIKDRYDTEMINNYIKKVEKENPELLL